MFKTIGNQINIHDLFIEILKKELESLKANLDSFSLDNTIKVIG